jgi:hypothetical protein
VGLIVVAGAAIVVTVATLVAGMAIGTNSRRATPPGPAAPTTPGTSSASPRASSATTAPAAPTTAGAPPAPATPNASGPQPAPNALFGTGDAETSPFDIQGGLTVFTCETSGSSRFTVELVNSAGRTLETLVSAPGSFTGLTGRNLAAGSYTLTITAGGDWTIVIAQPRDQSAQALPMAYSGQGQTFLGPFHAVGGVRLTMNDYGSSTFAVQVLNPDGSIQDSAVSTTGPYSGSTVDARLNGDYYLNVAADGSWTINLAPS